MGEYDSGIDGDWRRATLEDVAHFGFGIDDLNRELADIREIDLDPELAQRLLAITDEKDAQERSEEHTSELQSLMRISYAVFCLKKKNKQRSNTNTNIHRKEYHIKKTVHPIRNK